MNKTKTPTGDGNSLHFPKLVIYPFNMYEKKKTPTGDGNSFTNVPFIVLPFLFEWKKEKPHKGTVTTSIISKSFKSVSYFYEQNKNLTRGR